MHAVADLRCRTRPGPGLGRRDFLRLGSGLLAAHALGGLAGCGPDQPLRIALSPWAGYVFMFLALESGWLAGQGVEFVETELLSESVKALAEGRVDGAGLTLDEVLRLRAKGLPLEVVMVFNVSAGADAVLAGSRITSPEQLKGKRLAVEDSSLGAIMLANLLRVTGLDRDMLDIVLIGEDHLEAWNGGRLDAIITYEPALSRLEGLGLARILDSRSLPQVILDVLAMRPEAAERHGDALRALIAGHFRALDLWRRNPIDSAYRLAARLRTRPEDVGRIFKGLDLPDAIYNREYLSPPAAELIPATREIADIMLREGMLSGPVGTDRLFVPDYLPGKDS